MCRRAWKMERKQTANPSKIRQKILNRLRAKILKEQKKRAILLDLKY